MVRLLLHYCGAITIPNIKLNKLKKGGFKVGNNVTIDGTAWIDSVFPFLITIGDNSIICANVRIYAHDGSLYKNNKGYTRLGKVDIKENCIISANSIIMPGVTIGPNVVVAAGSLVNKNILPNSCVSGVPARFYMTFDDMIKNMNELINRDNTFKCEYNMTEGIKQKVVIDQIIENINKNNPVFVKL